MRHTAFLLALFCVGLGGAGCERATTEPYGQTELPQTRTEVGRGASQEQQQAKILNQIRRKDPDYQMFQKAEFNENNELGLVLGESVEMKHVPKLMKNMLTELAAEFPGQDLTVIAYTPTDPPARLGAARLNVRTREMIYEPQ